MDLEVFNLDVLGEIFGEDFNNGLLVGVEADVGIVAADLTASENDVFAFAEVSLEVVGVSCDVMELDEGGFFLVVSVNLKVVFMEDDIVDSWVVLENIRVDLFEKNFLTFK